MVKRKVKPEIKREKSSRRNLFLVSIFVIIILLAIVVYVLTSTNLKAIAGEAIRQRIYETKQLALTETAAQVEQASLQERKTTFIKCPPRLYPSENQNWKIDAGWKIWPLGAVEVRCADYRAFCYYGYSELEIDRADRLVTFQDISGVKNCKVSDSDGLKGCNCEIK